jgi:hypothetical protein
LDRRAIIYEFIKDNIDVLLDEKFPEATYKKNKHEFFFVAKKNAIGKPKDKEIAEISLSNLISKFQVHDKEHLEKILALPFYMNTIKDSDIYYEELRQRTESKKVAIDLSKMQKEEYLESLQEKIKEEVKQENKSVFDEEAQKLKDELEKARRELRSIPTVLHSHIIEPELAKMEPEVKKEWYEILQLKGDPFPRTDGLQNIDTKYHDQIIVQTEVFKRFIHYAQKDHAQIFKNIMFFGPYGSGKTVFFHYLRTVLLGNRILSTHVHVWPGPDSESNNHTFRQELVSRLEEECRSYGVTLQKRDNENFAQAIKDYISMLIEKTSAKGFIIIIDDLHKNLHVFDAVIEFLSYLQVFTDSISSMGKNKIALYIAGIPQWKERIEKETRVSGSIDKTEDMPQILEVDAHDMLNKRMIAFSNSTKKQNIVSRGFVKKVYELLQSTGSTVTFRDFIMKARDELKRGNFDDVLTINPSALREDTKTGIRDTILKNERLQVGFDKLTELVQKSKVENRTECLRQLGLIFLNEGISESDSQAQRNLWAFQQLFRAGLIQPYVSSKGTKWVVIKELTEAGNEILKKYDLSMEEYIIPVFSETTPKRKMTLVENEDLTNLRELAKRTSSNKADYESVISQHKGLLELETRVVIDIAPQDLVGRSIASIVALTKCYILDQNISYQINKEIIAEFWKEHWNRPAPIIEFINHAIDANENIDVNRAFFIFGIYKEAFSAITSLLLTQHHRKNYFPVTFDFLSNDDLTVLNDVRSLWLLGERKESIQKISEYMMTRLREMAYNMFQIFVGPYEQRMQFYDEDSKTRILLGINNDTKQRLGRLTNELLYISPRGFKGLITGKYSEFRDSKLGFVNWEQIFSHVFANLDRQTIYEYLEVLGEILEHPSINDSIIHILDREIRIEEFITQTLSLLKKMNEVYAIILLRCFHTYEEGAYFSFGDEVARKHPTTLIADTDVIRLSKQFDSLSEIKLDLSNSYSVTSFLKTEYLTVLLLIAGLIRNSESPFSNSPKKINIVSDKSPLFKFSID